MDTGPVPAGMAATAADVSVIGAVAATSLLHDLERSHTTTITSTASSNGSSRRLLLPAVLAVYAAVWTVAVGARFMSPVIDEIALPTELSPVSPARELRPDGSASLRD